MNNKTLALMIISLIVGGAIGATYITTLTNPEIATLTTKVNQLEANVNSLTTQNTAQTNLHNILQNSYTNLQSRYNNLQNQYTELNQQNTQLQTKYDELLTKYQLLLASIPLESISFSGTMTTKNYYWSFKGQTWSLSLSIPDSIYDYYQSLERTQTTDYSVYVTHPYDDAYISTIIEKFNIIAITNSLTESDKINLVILFVQSLPYTVDSVTTGYDEYPRYPVETLVEMGGDCEDTSILTAALLKAMNYDVILVNPPGHMAVGVNIPGTYGYSWTWNDNKYFYLETTGKGWKIGELPSEYKEASAYLYPLTPKPIITVTWKAEWVGKNLALSIVVKNVGTETARGYHVKAGLDAGDDKWRDVKSSDFFDIAPGREVTVNITLTPSKGYYTRLIIYVVNDQGTRAAESYSTWFNT